MPCSGRLFGSTALDTTLARESRCAEGQPPARVSQVLAAHHDPIWQDSPITLLLRSGISMLKGAFCVQLASEMSRFVSQRKGWTTTLFQFGTIGLLDELITAGRAASNGILSDSSFDDLKDQAIGRTLGDPGLGQQGERGALRNLLPRKAAEFRPSSYKYKAIEGLLPSLRSAYLENWGKELSQAHYLTWPATKKGESLTSPTEAASRITSFLLEEGVNFDYLARWLSYRTTHAPDEIEIEEFTSQIRDLYRKGKGKAEVLVLLEQTVSPALWQSLDLLSTEKSRKWLDEHNFTLSEEQSNKLHGGLKLSIEEWDLRGILNRVDSILTRIKRRAELNGWSIPKFSPAAWVSNIPTPQRIPHLNATNGLLGGQEVDSQSLLLPNSENRLEVSIEFVEAAATAGGASAAGMLWAALESLFAAPGDPVRLEVVSRAADIGLVAFVKFDFKNSLAVFMKNEKKTEIVRQLRSKQGDERFAMFESFLRAGDFSQVSRRGVKTRLEHTADLITADGFKTRRIELQTSLRALYRHRNMVLHGGVNDAPLLGSVLRGGYPLVCAIVVRYGRDSQKSGEDPYSFATSCYLKVERYLWEPNRVLDIF